MDTPALDYDPADLPNNMVEICEVIGFEAVLKLIEAYGGLTLDIPKQMTLTHELYALLGPDAAIKLSWYCAGRTYIQKCREMKGKARKRALESMRFSHTRKEMARLFDIAERRVYQILA